MSSRDGEPLVIFFDRMFMVAQHSERYLAEVVLG